MKLDKIKVSKVEIRGGSNLSTSDDDENGELLTDELEKGFFKVLSRLKKKDSKLYEENLEFFPVEDSKTDFENHKLEKKKKEKVKKDYKEWLKGQKDKIDDKKVKRDLEALHDFWANPNLSKEDQFLRDYILNRKFLDEEEDFDIKKAVKKLEEEEKELQKEVIFEQKYNHRFETTNNDCLKKHPKPAEITFGKKRKSNSVMETKEKLQNMEVAEANTKPITKKKRRKQKTKFENKSAVEAKAKIETEKIPNVAKRFKKKKEQVQYKLKLSHRKKILQNVSLYSNDKSEKKKKNRRKDKIRHRVLIKQLGQTVKPSKSDLLLVKMKLLSEKAKKLKNISVENAIKKNMKKSVQQLQHVQSGKKGIKVKARTGNKSGR